MIKLKDLLNIKEASGLGSALGGKVNPVRKAGYKSAGATSAQSDYKLKKADYGAKSAQYDTALAAKDDSKRYRKNIGTVRRPAYTYSGSPIKGGETNPDWTTQSADVMTRGSQKAASRTARDSAETSRDAYIEKDRLATVGVTPPASSGGMKASGKGSRGGKKGKKK